MKYAVLERLFPRAMFALVIVVFFLAKRSSSGGAGGTTTCSGEVSVSY